jgi:cytochrome P450
MDAQEWASRATLDIIGLAGLGHDFNSVADPNSELNRCYRAIFSSQRGALVLLFLSLMLPQKVLMNLPIKRNLEAVAARGLIRRVCFDLVAEKRAKLEKGIVEKDILSVAIESGGFDDDEDIVNQLMTFLAAGHETTASAMSWACYHLCQHPKVQARLRTEIREHLPSPDSGEQITAADFDKLPYLSAVCNETLRLFPSVPLTLRTTEGNDSTILGQPIPQGAAIIICPWAVNCDPAMWGDDAEEFNPDRWMAPGQANSGGATSNYAFLTFLHGPRSCIGQQFARAEFQALLATWVGRMEMKFADENYVLEIRQGITSKPKENKIHMTKAEGW